jgi:dTDP-4-dehydrorhamnose reductase
VQALPEARPAAVINAAAYTNVERAESEEELATVVNGEAVGVLARWCAGRDVPFVHFSTDYVYSEAQDRPHVESDPVGPINAYGRSKLEGERQTQAASGRYLILRTSWVYDATGKNFFRTMARLAQERDSLKVVSDQFGAPTYAPHLAKGTWHALQRAMGLSGFPTGIYHLCNTGETSWFDFAQAIFHGLRQRGVALRVQSTDAIATRDYPSAVSRPLDSRLSTERAAQVLGVQLPPWQQGLTDCLEVYS